MTDQEVYSSPAYADQFDRLLTHKKLVLGTDSYKEVCERVLKMGGVSPEFLSYVQFLLYNPEQMPDNKMSDVIEF